MRLRRILATAAFVILAFVAAPHAWSQTPAPTTAASTSDDETTGKPWSRLVFYVPAAIAIGVGTVYARRLLRSRGWSQS